MCKNNEDIDHQDVKIYFTTNQFPELQFCVPHNKPHDVSGLSEQYHMRFDTKLGHETCSIQHSPCMCNQ